MPLKSSLPKGSTGIRGASDIPHIRSLGGQAANQANRLYMCTVRRESLLSKRQSLKTRLAEIDQQLRGLEDGIRAIDKKYQRSLKLKTRKRHNAVGDEKTGRKMVLKF